MAKAKGKSKPKPQKTRTVEFDGEQYNLPIIRKGGVPLTDDERIIIAELVCKMYATDQFSLEDCLRHCGVRSKSTWWYWVNSIEPIERLYYEAQDSKDREYKHRLKHRARTMAERLIDGYCFEVEEHTSSPVIVKEGEKPNIDGLEIVTVKKKTIFVKPSVPIILNTLYNTDGRTFTRNPEPYKAGNEEIPKEIKITIQSGSSVPPVTSEDDIKQDV